MANWYGVTRTNYFKVKDEKRYQELFSKLVSEEFIEDFSTVKKGELYHAFGSYSSISYQGDTDDDEVDYYQFMKEISKILTEDSMFVSTCVGNEKLRYITGVCFVVFSDGVIMQQDLSSFAYDLAEERFGKDYELYLDY